MDQQVEASVEPYKDAQTTYLIYMGYIFISSSYK